MNTENQEDKKPIGHVDQSQIDAWKNHYKTRKINFIITEDQDGNKHITYLKQPEMGLLTMLKAKAKKDQEFEALSTILNTLRIGGSDEVLEDYHMKFGAMQSVGELLRAVKGTLGKL